MHECLREHREKLSEACRKEELRLEEEEAESVELRPGLRRRCKGEIRVRECFPTHVCEGE